MNKQDAVKQLALLQAEVDKLKSIIDKPCSKVWEPSKKDLGYIVVGNGDIQASANMDVSKVFFELGNCYPSKELAEKAIAKQKALVRVTNKLRELEGDWEPNWKNSSQGKYTIIFHHSRKVFFSDNNYILQCQGKIYSTKNACDWIIDNMQDDLKLIMDIQS
jgi:hypothetical protein